MNTTSFSLNLFDEGATKSIGIAPRAPDPVTLDGFPLLVRAPQYGHGVATEDNGTPALALAAAVRVIPDHAILAEQFGTTEAHIRQALEYAEATRTT